jgi:hypothetical protein
MKRIIVLVAAIVVLGALAVPATGIADRPVVNEHDNFTSDPYPDDQCGIAGTSVDMVHDQFKQDASGASIENINIKTLFVATASGKSMTIQTSEVSKTGAPVDNGDGTFTTIVRNAGLSPKFTFQDGTHVIDVGAVGFEIVRDANGEFLSFELLYQHGQRPAGCDTITAELS